MLIVALGALVLPAARLAAAPPEGFGGESRILDRDTVVDANNISMFVTNQGSFAYDIPSARAGLVFPRGSLDTAMFAGGLWVGAWVDGEAHVTVSEYSWEFAPGGMTSLSEWDDPFDERFRVYKIQVGDTPETNPDYAEWPVADGAPVDEHGLPRHLGLQTLWALFNDADRSWHWNVAGTSPPLGIEVHQTGFALGSIGAESNVVFLEWRITNKGNETLDDTYIAFWCDPDLGGAGDDLVGCDPDAGLGYCYNATNGDLQYGAAPPSVAIQLLQGPIVPSPGDIAWVSGEAVPDYRNLPLTAFVKYINGTDPASSEDSYNCMQGLDRNGDPIFDPTTLEVTTFMHSGDPVTGSGWLDADPADRRMMLSTGPIDLAVGETQVVAVAVVIGQGADRLDSITDLRRRTSSLPAMFQTVMAGETGACCSTEGECSIVPAASCTGIYFAGGTCDPDPCAVSAGACCFFNGTCLLALAEDCAGDYLGDGSTCAPGSCPESGPEAACCLMDGTCEVLVEAICSSQGGTYWPGQTCGLVPPGDEPGWQRLEDGALMIDETFGPGGVPVPPDGRGGPGNNVWHSDNSTFEWILSAGGGTGGISRFTRDGADEANLGEADVILRWDNDPDNIGWWYFNDGEVATIPFGFYERDPFTGEEHRLIVLLVDETPGIYDYTFDWPDPFSGYPATDWSYAYRFTGTYEDFLADAQDGRIDSDPLTDELFARMIFASPDATFPATGTVIQFSTKKSGIVAGSGFVNAVPLAWPVAVGGAFCLDPPLYDVYLDGEHIATTDRTDWLESGLVNGQSYEFRIATRNSNTGETSDLSIGVFATPRTEGYAASCGREVAPPVLDGTIHETEWAHATQTDARAAPTGRPATLYLMNSPTSLRLGLDDGVSADDFSLYLDVNGNGVYDVGGLEGVLHIVAGEVTFTRLEGVYPDVVAQEEIPSPPWAASAGTANQLEVSLALDAGPLVNRPPSGLVPMFFYSWGGAAAFPAGPPSVVGQAPLHFADIQLAIGQGPPSVAIIPRPAPRAAVEASILLPGVSILTFPNPSAGSTTIAYRLPSPQGVSAAVWGVRGEIVRRLQASRDLPAGVHALVWDGRDDRGRIVPAGVYFCRVKGEEPVDWTRRVMIVR